MSKIFVILYSQKSEAFFSRRISQFSSHQKYLTLTQSSEDYCLFFLPPFPSKGLTTFQRQEAPDKNKTKPAMTASSLVLPYKDRGPKPCCLYSAPNLQGKWAETERVWKTQTESKRDRERLVLPFSWRQDAEMNRYPTVGSQQGWPSLLYNSLHDLFIQRASHSVYHLQAVLRQRK